MYRPVIIKVCIFVILFLDLFYPILCSSSSFSFLHSKDFQFLIERVYKFFYLGLQYINLKQPKRILL